VKSRDIVGQFSIFDIVVDDTEELITRHICRGSGCEDGKYRIKTYINANLRMSEFPKWLADEYGLGGWSFLGEGSNHDSKGVEIYRRSDNKRIHLTWPQVAARIIDLHSKGLYYTERDEESHQRNIQYKVNDVRKGATWYYTEEQRAKILSGDYSIFNTIRYLSKDDEEWEE
jgi:hypothetical protein